MKEDQLGLFKGTDWPKIGPKLIKYTEMKITKKRWRSGAQLPKGWEAPDVAYLAIEKTYNAIMEKYEEESGYRNWNQAVNPDLWSHLTSAVDSELSNLVNLKEHKVTNYSGDTTQEAAFKIFEQSVNATLVVQSEEPQLDDVFCSQLMKSLYKKFENDERETLVLMSFEEQAERDDIKMVKSNIVAKETDLKIEEVYNALKRIRRAAEEILDKSKREVKDE